MTDSAQRPSTAATEPVAYMNSKGNVMSAAEYHRHQTTPDWKWVIRDHWTPVTPLYAGSAPTSAPATGATPLPQNGKPMEMVAASRYVLQRIHNALLSGKFYEDYDEAAKMTGWVRSMANGAPLSHTTLATGATPSADAVTIARVLSEDHDPIGQNEVFILANEILRLARSSLDSPAFTVTAQEKAGDTVSPLESAGNRTSEMSASEATRTEQMGSVDGGGASSANGS